MVWNFPQTVVISTVYYQNFKKKKLSADVVSIVASEISFNTITKFVEVSTTAIFTKMYLLKNVEANKVTIKSNWWNGRIRKKERRTCKSKLARVFCAQLNFFVLHGTEEQLFGSWVSKPETNYISISVILHINSLLKKKQIKQNVQSFEQGSWYTMQPFNSLSAVDLNLYFEKTSMWCIYRLGLEVCDPACTNGNQRFCWGHGPKMCQIGTYMCACVSGVYFIAWFPLTVVQKL